MSFLFVIMCAVTGVGFICYLFCAFFASSTPVVVVLVCLFVRLSIVSSSASILLDSVIVCLCVLGYYNTGAIVYVNEFPCYIIFHWALGQSVGTETNETADQSVPIERSK